MSHTERFVKASFGGAPQSERRPAAACTAGARLIQFDGVFGDSPRLIEALEIAEKAARTDLPVLVDGESGTGKELMAKVIHANGNRADQPYITVNCGAIPENLLESELFGHKRGAFTGASTDRAGKFEAANGGTIFLDEIGELPLIGQVKLLRVLQSNEIQRVGSDQVISVDARIVAATNKNLLEMCKAGTFREDLYYRLSIIQVTLPPLRDRRDEISLLIEYLSNEAASRLTRQPVKLSRRLTSFLSGYDYPGNIRELRNIHFPDFLPGERHGRSGTSAHGHPARAAGSGCERRARRRWPRGGPGGARRGQACRQRPGRARVPGARLARGRRRGDRTGQALRHEPVPRADAAEEARHPVQGLPQRERAAPLAAVTATGTGGSSLRA